MFSFQKRECVVCHNDFIPKSGSHAICSDECRSIRFKQWRQENSEHLKQSRADWNSKNRDKIREQSRIRYHNGGKVGKDKSRSKYLSSLRGQYFRTRALAKQRNIEWDLNLESFQEIVIQPCHYCGEIESRRGRSGLDRIDSTKSYTKDNVIPCCYWCNVSKHTATYESFLISVGRIFLRHEEKIRSLVSLS